MGIMRKLDNIARTVGGKLIDSGGGVPNIEIILDEGMALYLGAGGWYVSEVDGKRIYDHEDFGL